MSNTDRFRKLFVSLFTAAVITALAGWVMLDRDTSTLGPVLGWLALAVGIGEASNVGKRATWKREAHEADADTIRRDA